MKKIFILILGKGLLVGKTLSKEKNLSRYRWSAEDNKKLIHLDCEFQEKDSNLLNLEFISY